MGILGTFSAISYNIQHEKCENTLNTSLLGSFQCSQDKYCKESPNSQHTYERAVLQYLFLSIYSLYDLILILDADGGDEHYAEHDDDQQEMKMMMMNSLQKFE